MLKFINQKIKKPLNYSILHLNPNRFKPLIIISFIIFNLQFGYAAETAGSTVEQLTEKADEISKKELEKECEKIIKGSFKSINDNMLKSISNMLPVLVGGKETVKAEQLEMNQTLSEGEGQAASASEGNKGGVLNQIGSAIGGVVDQVKDTAGQIRDQLSSVPNMIGQAVTKAINSADTKNSPVCSCKLPSPLIMKIGFTTNYWENVGLIEATAIPYCVPTLETYLDLTAAGEAVGSVAKNTIPKFIETLLGVTGTLATEGGSLDAGMAGTEVGGDHVGKASGKGQREASDDEQYMVGHFHFMPFMSLMDIISKTITSMCGNSGADTAAPSFSELNPFTQKDEWSILENPVELLVANPIAVAACIPESITISLFGMPISPMFWCFGTWGARYPETIHVGSGMPLNAYSKMATTALARQFGTTGSLKDNTGKHMLENYCTGQNALWIPKWDLGIHPVFPELNRKRFPIGTPSELWGLTMDGPGNYGVWVYGVWQNRDCCFL